MKFEPRDYQADMIRFALERGTRGAGWFVDPGLGKTAAALTVIKIWIACKTARAALVVAPLRVCASTWPGEIADWSAFRGLRARFLHGKNKAAELAEPADVYLINPEGLKWLFEVALKGRRKWPFDILVVDESTIFKNPASKRFKMFWAKDKDRLARFKYRIVMTGTPTPQGYGDLFAQLYLVDKGETFGRKVTPFRTKFFYQAGYNFYQWDLIPGKDKRIEELIAPAVLRIDGADYLDLPEILYNDIKVDIPTKARRAYDEIEKELFTVLDGEDQIAAARSHAYGLCRQIAGGGMYQTKDAAGRDRGRKVFELHKAKVEAVVDLVNELNGKPVLIGYHYKHELDRLRRALGKSTPYIGAGVSPKKSAALVAAWNSEDFVGPLLGNPASMSHGLNMQYGRGRDVVWFTLTDNLEHYEQFNRRVARPGLKKGARIHRIMVNDSVDQAVADLLDRKDKTQTALLQALKRYRKRKG